MATQGDKTTQLARKVGELAETWFPRVRRWRCSGSSDAPSASFDIWDLNSRGCARKLSRKSVKAGSLMLLAMARVARHSGSGRSWFSQMQKYLGHS